MLETPTASGKSLACTVPAFERAMDHVGTTLYVGPQVALIDDQRATLSMLCACPRDDGCPTCVQSQHCENANDPLDRALAIQLLAGLTGTEEF